MLSSNDLLLLAIRAAVKAGSEILSVYSEKTEVELKPDNSPLTRADKLSHKAIIKMLDSSGYPVLSEEGKNISYDERKSWDYFWMVDPLDGTKEFIKKNGEFTVNIALIHAHNPVLGVVYVPVSGTLYFADKNTGSYKYNGAVQSMQSKSLEDIIKHSDPLPLPASRGEFTVVASRSHLTDETGKYIDELKKKHGNINFLSAGSSIKICLVAEGSADVYPRLAPTMEWDTAAGHAIAVYAGKSFINFNSGKPMRYNKESLLNDWFVVE